MAREASRGLLIPAAAVLVTACAGAAKELASNPSAAVIAQVVSNVSGASTAAKNFASPISSKCS